MPSILRPEVCGPDYESERKIDTGESGQFMECKMVEMAVYGDVPLINRKESRSFRRPDWRHPANVSALSGSSE